MTGSDYRNILIIKPSALGDIALALPALSSLRSSFPGAKITWLVRPEYAPLLEQTTGLDRILIFDRKTLARWFCHPKAFCEMLRFCKKLRTGQFDLVIDLQGLFRTAFFGWISGCKKRFGTASAREFAAFFYTDRIQPDPDSLHVIDNYLKIVSAAGAPVADSKYNLRPGPEDSDTAIRLLKENDVDPDKYVVFVTGSAHERKCWPVDKFAALADRIHSEFGMSLVAVGTSGEKPAVDLLQKTANVSVLNLAGRTDIGVLTAVLGHARLVVSNDTGPGHIAVALGTATVIIFGPTNPSRIKPYKKTNGAVAIDPDGRGAAINDFRDEYNIENITVDQVFEKVIHHLAPDKVQVEASG